jgi:hypothetical protein
MQSSDAKSLAEGPVMEVVSSTGTSPEDWSTSNFRHAVLYFRITEDAEISEN